MSPISPNTARPAISNTGPGAAMEVGRPTVLKKGGPADTGLRHDATNGPPRENKVESGEGHPEEPGCPRDVPWRPRDIGGRGDALDHPPQVPKNPGARRPIHPPPGPPPHVGADGPLSRARRAPRRIPHRPLCPVRRELHGTRPGPVRQ